MKWDVKMFYKFSESEIIPFVIGEGVESLEKAFEILSKFSEKKIMKVIITRKER